MVKDYFQDIVPPHESDDENDVGLLRREEGSREAHAQNTMAQGGHDKSIRNININRRATFGTGSTPPPRERRGGKYWVWILAALCLAALAFLVFLFAFKQTSIALVPHSQTVLFDETSQFTAYPAGSVASGTISYTIKSADFEDAEAVPASGTEHKQEKASGTITIVNEYSEEPVKLLKNTRFITASGLIFRAPAEVTVPGKKGATPGKISVTVAADKAGDEYNIGANQKLTLPGLEQNAAMHAGVYAVTAASTTGGFAGEAPAVEAGALQGAKATIQARLDKKIAEYIATLNSETDLPLKPIVTYADLPSGAVSGGSVNVRMGAHVSVPVVPRGALSSAIAQAVTSSTSDQAYILKAGQGFAANVIDAADIGNDPITFTLSGSGLLVANVDTEALAKALAGRDQAAFQAIVANYPGVQSAKARIEPFWNSSFPTDPSQIEITVIEAQNEE